LGQKAQLKLETLIEAGWYKKPKPNSFSICSYLNYNGCLDGFAVDWGQDWIRGAICVSIRFFCISGICLVANGIN